MAPQSTTEAQVLTQIEPAISSSTRTSPVKADVFSSTKGYQLKEDISNKKSSLPVYQVITFVSLFLGYATYNLARKAITYVAPSLMLAGILSQNHAGVLSSSQSAAYAVSKFIGGVVSDRLSARKLFATGLFVSGISAVLVASTENTSLWVPLWFLNGLAQGCGWPACAKLMKKWFSSKHFGTCWSLITASSNVAGTFGPMFSAFLLLNFSWKYSVFTTGALSIMMGISSLIFLVDDPKQAGLPPVEIVTKSNDKRVSDPKSQGDTMTWGQLLTSPLLWVIAGSYLVAFGIKTALTDWGQVYMIQTLGHSQIQASAFSSSFETGGFCGGIIAGILTDRLKNKVSTGSNPRLVVASAFLIATITGLHLMSFQFDSQSTQMMTSLVAFLLGASVFGPISIFGIVASESFPPSISGSAHAVVALAANAGAVFAGWPLSKLAQVWGWSTVLVFLEILSASVIFLIHMSGPWHSLMKKKVE